MSYKTCSVKVITICAFLLFVFALESDGQFFNLPPLPPPDEFGNILINRNSEKNGVKPTTFSHWIHRQRYTCRVCHFELEFNMELNTTEITESQNRSGMYCGASGCHDGKTAFGHEDKGDCEKCHNGDKGYKKERFSELSKLPKTRFGNGIDWVKAMEGGMIKPKDYLTIKPSEGITFDKKISPDIKMAFIPPSIFPHKPHVEWLDCNNCHPYIFNIKEKTTKGFSMAEILKRRFCGVCHLTVAFPMDDCKRCHVGMGEY